MEIVYFGFVNTILPVDCHLMLPDLLTFLKQFLKPFVISRAHKKAFSEKTAFSTFGKQKESLLIFLFNRNSMMEFFRGIPLLLGVREGDYVLLFFYFN